MNTILLRLMLLSLPRWGNASVQSLLKEVGVNKLDNLELLITEIQKVALKNKRIKVPLVAEMKLAEEHAKNIIECCNKYEIEILTPENKHYPARVLSRSSVAPPPAVLYAKGNIEILNSEKIFALIGTRKPLAWVYEQMKAIGLMCAEKNIVVLSGLALGCDAAAHTGCLEIRGKAIGVLGGGLDRISPKKNTALSESILENNGCLISEYPPEIKQRSYQLVSRDKLQASMSDKVIVGQATVDGGTMHAANYALDKLTQPVGVLMKSTVPEESFSGNKQLIVRGAESLTKKNSIEAFLL